MRARESHVALAVGLVTALLCWWVWGSMQPVPAFHDEASYLLQARIFAGGHWTAPARPLPEFFDQFYVLSTPVTASRYPPGHSLLLALGELVHWPAVVPLTLSGITGAFLFALVARLRGPLTAGLTWVLWLLAPLNLVFRPTYLSNVTTAAVWIIGWWALLRWSERPTAGWAVLLGMCVGWCIITRPITGLVFALSLAWPVFAVARHRELWRQARAAALSAAAVSVLLPLANQRTTGSWSQLPWTEYARQYMPYDRLGFGLDSTPPARFINQELAAYNHLAIPYRRDHQVSALPRIAIDRAGRIGHGMWGLALPLLLPAAMWGIVKAPRQTRWTLWAAILLFAVHLGYAHPPQWTAYYMEALPVLAFFTAVGLAWLLAPGQPVGPVRTIMRVVAGASVAVWLLLSADGLSAARRRSVRLHRAGDTFSQRVATVQEGHAVIFVRHPPSPSPNVSLVANEPDLARARLWIVHDLGPRDTALVRLATGRVAYLYDERTQTLTRWKVSDTAMATPAPR